MNVVGSEEVADTTAAAVGCPMSNGPLLGRPRRARLRLNLNRSELIEADYDRVFRRPLVESVDAFFLKVNSGSFDSFQVRVRW